MKKYIILLFFAPIMLSAQIRVGMDLGRVATLKAGGEEIPYPGTKPENLAISFGKEARKKVIEEFQVSKINRKTIFLYKLLLAQN